MSSIKWLFGLVVLLIAVVLALHWPSAERQPAPDAGVGLVRSSAMAPREPAATPALTAPGREPIAAGADFSPPPGNVAAMASPASPFVSLSQGNTSGTIGDWGRGATETAGAFWRAALAKIGILAPTTSAPAQNTATNTATPAAATGRAQTSAPDAAPNFETPPGIGSPRGGK